MSDLEELIAHMRREHARLTNFPDQGYDWRTPVMAMLNRVPELLDALESLTAATAAGGPPALSTKHDFTDGERCSFCDVNQWEITTGENDCTPHPFISFTTETPAKTGPPSGDAGYPGSDW